MSGVLKSIKKTFKSVVKVVKKVAPFALAAAAVVFTGGAALGLTPTFAGAVGGVAAKLGLSTTLTGALTGSITSAGFGAAAGGLMGGTKGMQTGVLAGAVGGGLMGGIAPSTFGIVKGVDGTTTMAALRNGGNAFAAAGSKTPTYMGSDGIMRVGSGNLAPGSNLANTVGGLADGVAVPTPVAPAAGGGNLVPGSPFANTIGSLTDAPMARAAGGATPGFGTGGGTGSVTGIAPTGFDTNKALLASSLLKGVSGAFSKSDSTDAAKVRAEYERQMGYFAYGGGDPDGKGKAYGHVPGVYSGQADPFGIRPLAAAPQIRPEQYYTPQAKRWAYNPATNTVEKVGG